MTVPPQINDSDGVDINHLIDLSDPGSWLDAIAHTPCLNVSDYASGDGAETLTTPADPLPLAGVPAAVPQSAVRAAGDGFNSSHFTGDSE